MTAKNQEINWAADDLYETNTSSDKRIRERKVF
jgi:hypothetical protein